MPPDVPRDDDGPHALGLQYRTNQPSWMGLLQRASRFFTLPQMPSSSTNVTLFNGARQFQVHGPTQFLNAYNLHVANTYGGNHDLLDMKPSVSFGALHDSYADDPEHRCRPETRQYVLKRLQGWIDDVTSVERIFWLHGSAGSGKSAIAHTIADSNGQDKVAATFFFCRSDTERNNGNRLFITLAWQLALSIPSIKSHIIQSLNRNPGLPWKSVETQFKELIVQPFQEIMHDPASQALLPSLVVIIDGIDECTDESLQRRILGVIGSAANNAHVPLRFLISSRLEAHIESAIDQLKCPILCIDLRLEKLEELVSFDAIHNSRGQNLARPWNSSSREHSLQQLQSWFDNWSSEPISWLHGPAGSGKSAIAQSIADLNERGKLGKVAATFFFHRFKPTRNDGTRLFPTLCWQLASSIPTYKDYIVQYLVQCSFLPKHNVDEQFEELIVRPFGSVKPPRGWVVIINGMDECADLHIQRKCLQAIENNVKHWRIPLRFLITSSSGGHVQQTMECFRCRTGVFTIDLGISPLDIGTSARPDHNLRTVSAKDWEGYRYRFPYHFGLLSEPAIALTLPPTYDSGLQNTSFFHQSSNCKLRYSSFYEIHGDCVISNIENYEILNHEAVIKKYLRAEFSRIARMQGLVTTWPGQHVIEDLAHRSSGHFIYANTIVKLIGEGHSNAETLLNLILDLQPRTEMPFAHLDELYFQILKWQPDQVFLKNVLALIVVRTSILRGYGDLCRDDAVLMNVSEEELQTKLRQMRSLLVINPDIDVHHQSFLDFLQEVSRSGQYHISKEEGSRRYLKLITGSLVRYVNKMLNQPDHDHFMPQFSRVVSEYPGRIELPVAEWQEVLQPLLKLGRKMFISCADCTTVRIIRDLLLHFAFLRVISSIQSTEPTVDETEERIDDTTDDSLHNCLCPLLTHLRSPRSRSSQSDTEIMTQLCTVLYFDCAEIAARIHSVSDAQNLVDVIVDTLDEKIFFAQGGPDVKRKAILLTLEIYARIPVLPRSLFLGFNIKRWYYQSSEIETLCQSTLIVKILNSDNREEGKLTFVGWNGYERRESLRQWRKRAYPRFGTAIQVMLEVAKAFRYLHSMGVILHYDTDSDDIFLDSELSPTIRFMGSFLLYIVKTPSICLKQDSKVLMTREANVFNFGCLFYQTVFNVNIPLEDRMQFKRDFIVKRSKRPTNLKPDHVWKLIQLCCGEDSKRRPTMDEVVEEMKTWSLPPLLALRCPQGPPLEDETGSDDSELTTLFQTTEQDVTSVFQWDAQRIPPLAR